MKDIQVGDYIDTLTDKGEQIHAQILYIPKQPGEPWVVKDQHNRKWRIHTTGMFTRTFSQG